MPAALLSVWFALNGVPAPVSEETRHLPPYAVAVAGWKMAKDSRDHIDRELQWAPGRREQLQPLREEAVWRVKVWDTLIDVQNPNARPEYRREKLAELRQEIGPDAFWRGVLPCPFVEAALWGD
jgi:hypothetical protein